MAKSATRRAIEGAGFLVLESRRLPNGLGKTYILAGRIHVIKYDTGTIVIGGRPNRQQRHALERAFGLGPT